MRLLIITQKIDRKDSVLGFFHRWVEEFSKHLGRITVVCLQKGDYDLPGNVAVLSLGKEKWQSTMKYVFLLFYFSIRYFNRYDAVLVHMNQEYILVAGWLWKILGKKIYMWRNHYAGSLLTDMAATFCTKIFCTSHYSYTAKFRKTRFMPVGVDTDLFKPAPNVSRAPGSILSLGRIAPSKKIDTLLRALKILKDQNVNFSADIYGNASDPAYADMLAKEVKSSGLEKYVKFRGAVPNRDTPAVYSAHEIFVNLSPNGMYDKTIFEAMACGSFVFASNDDLKDKLDSAFAFEFNNAVDLAQKIKTFLAASREEKQQKALGISGLIKEHSLHKLALELTAQIK